MDNISQSLFSKYIEKIHIKSGYLDKYGGSVVATCLTLLIFFLVFSYFYTLNRLKPIRADWVNQRCNPSVMPFAGLINPPPGESKLDFTAKNFSGCVSDILTKIVHVFLQPIYYASSLITEFFNELAKAVQSVRKLFDIIRQQITEIVQQIMNRIMNVLVPLRIIMGKLRTIMAKTQATLTTALYVVLTAYLSMRSFLGAFIEIIIIGLIALAAAAVVLWILIFTFPAAAVLTALFVAVSVPFALILVALFRILKLTTHGKKIPPNPKCFGKNTPIRLVNGTVPIQDVRVGDVLETGGKVSATFLLTVQGESVYQLGDIIVTGSHLVYVDNRGWVSVRDHLKSELLDDYREPYVYCINSTDKTIQVGDEIFLDWDEMDSKDCENLKNCAYEYLPPNCALSDIHRYMDGGFTEDTELELEDGLSVPIGNIRVGDQLRFGERVLGTVQVDTTDLRPVKRYNIRGYTFSGGPNIRIEDNDLGNMSTLDMDGTPIEMPEKLFHLVTDTKHLMINGIRFCDYNGGLEKILWPNEYSYSPF